MFMTVEKVRKIVTHVLSSGPDGVFQRISETRDDIDKLRSDLDDAVSKINELNHLRDRKESDEPWFEFVGGEVHPEHGLELRLDWNDAFINQLRTQGYKGTSDDELIAQYIANVQKSVEGRE